MPFDWLKHAFAIEPEGSAVPTDAQRDVIDRVCRQIAARELTTPALLFLETVRPLNYVTAQTLHFFAPLLSAVADPAACDEFAAFLEQRGSVDYLCRRIEELDRERNEHSKGQCESAETATQHPSEAGSTAGGEEPGKS